MINILYDTLAVLQNVHFRDENEAINKVFFSVQESIFLRCALYVLTSLTTMSIFGSALATSHLYPSLDNIPIVPDRNLYAKVSKL